jgi:hypothetical protein
MKNAKQRRRRVANAGSFRPGPDPRRHSFTKAEQSRGGYTTWARYMREWRGQMFGRGWGSDV